MKNNIIIVDSDSLRFISGGLSGELYPGYSGWSDGSITLFKNIFERSV